MPIDTTHPGNNIGVNDVPLFQDWNPEPRIINIVKSTQIPFNFNSFIEQIKIKDVIGLYPQFTDFRLVIVRSTSPSWIEQFIQPFDYTLNGVSYPNNIIPITQNGLIVYYPVDLVNINLLNVGIYRYKQIFRIQARVSGFLYTTISSMTHETVLRINNNLVLVNPDKLIYNHVIGTTLPEQTVILNGPIWFLSGSPRYELTSSSPNVTIQSVQNSDGDIFQIANGSGTASVKVRLGDFFDIPSDVNVFMDSLNVSTAEQVVSNLLIRVNRTDADVFTLSPAELLFTATINISNAIAQNLLFECNAAYQIQSPLWLSTLVQEIDIDGVPRQVITVTPQSSNSIAAGTYIGLITVLATINGVVTVRSVTVTYRVYNIALLPYNEQLAFTLDNKFIEITTFNIGTYMQMNLSIETFDFYTDASNLYNIQEKIGLFEGKANVNIGKTIHQILSKEKKINENTLQYKPAIVSLFFEEKTIQDHVFVRSAANETLSFVAGLSNNFNKIGFLKFNHAPESVTIKTHKYLNIYVPRGTHRILTYKNNVLFLDEILPESEGKIITFKVGFSQFTQADKIEFQIANMGNHLFSKSIFSSKICFIVLPEELFSNHIYWEDEFLLKQAIECKGDYAIKGGLSFISQKKYKDLVEHLSHLNVTDQNRLSINTGWLIRSDIDTIKSLMKSKKAWIIAFGKKIMLIPTAEAMTSEDSQRELIDFNLEFQINPAYNEETYRL